MQKKKVLTIKEAAQLIDGINEFRIRTMCKTGELRAFKAGRKYLIAESDLYETVFGKEFAEEETGGAA
ncbi:MAG: helix-turn-helix domain-containing protein [Ruminiclostridium sp.]|nr:helix-turn-helix domain-containing protein [Ruminiclostridium sp.]